MATPELVKLADIVQLSPLVTRILGQNPGPYTLQGTNTYLIGSRGSSAILLDTGENRPEYLPLLRQALKQNAHTGISDILLSHYHHDHVLGLQGVLPLLRELGWAKPRIHKFPCIRAPHLDKTLSEILEANTGSFERRSDGSATFELKDGQRLSVPGDTSSSLEVVSTPGHTDDSVSFLLSAREGRIVFTADTVLGQGTAVFTDLKALLASLDKCIQKVSSSEEGQTTKTIKLFCGHGPVVDDGVAKMKEYIQHRLQRENQVVEALQKAGKPMTARELVRAVYGPELPEKLVIAAEHGLVLHLEKLEQENRVRKYNDRDEELRWELVGTQRDTKV